MQGDAKNFAWHTRFLCDAVPGSACFAVARGLLRSPATDGMAAQCEDLLATGVSCAVH